MILIVFTHTCFVGRHVLEFRAGRVYRPPGVASMGATCSYSPGPLQALPLDKNGSAFISSTCLDLLPSSFCLRLSTTRRFRAPVLLMKAEKRVVLMANGKVFPLDGKYIC